MKLRLSSAVAMLGFGLIAGNGAAVAQTANRGKEVFEKRCTGCHALDTQKVGPPLRTVFGRAAGSVPSFPYSNSLRQSGIKWDSRTLDQWLAGTDLLVPDNDMAFRVADPKERTAVIGYLKQLSTP